MGKSADEFLNTWIDSGLITRNDAGVFVATLASPPQTAEDLARLTVREKRLTAFQAQSILRGRGKGLVLGNYHILDELGRGGMGVVYKARHRVMKREVALKVLPAKVAQDPALVERFHREVEAAARLTHPHVVAAYDADEAKGTHFFCMELVDGCDLSSFVKQRGVLPVSKAVECILQAARGLQYAHERGVVHRDIKPGNLLLDKLGVVKILDLGLARIEGEVGEQAQLTGTGDVMGTVDYMAPEQAVSTKDADARSDIYSLGISFWFLLTGKPAYEGTSLMARMLAHRDAPLPSLRVARQEVATQLDRIFQKMIAKRREERYQSMAEVVAELEAFVAGKSVATPSLSNGPSEDGKFQAFLGQLSQQMGERSPFPSGLDLRTRPLDLAAAPPGSQQPQPDDADTPTRIVTSSQESTDPKTVSLHMPKPKPTAGTVGDRGPRQQRWPLWVAFAGIVLLGIILIIKSKDGKETRIDVAEGSDLSVDDQGNVVVVPPGVVSAEGMTSSPSAALAFDGEEDYVRWNNFPFPADGELQVELSATVHSVARQELNISWLLNLGAGFQVNLNGTDPERPTLGVSGLCTDGALYNWNIVTPVTLGERFTLGIQIKKGDAQFTLNGRAVEVSDLRTSRTFDGTVDRYVPFESTLRSNSGLAFLGVPTSTTPTMNGREFHGLIHDLRIMKSDGTPIALYDFSQGSGDVLKDVSGNGQDGEIIGATWVKTEPVATNGMPPANELMLEFDGKSSYVEAPLMNMPVEGPWTIEYWVQADPSTLPGTERVMNTCHAFWGQHFDSSIALHADEFILKSFRRVTDQFTHVGYVVSNATLADGLRHYAAVWDGEGLAVYHDGQLCERSDAIIPAQNPDLGQHRLVIGTGLPPASFGDNDFQALLKGKLDEFRVSSVVRYSGSQFVPQRRFVPDRQTVVLFHMDEGAGNILQDASGNGNHGTIMSAKWATAGNAAGTPHVVKEQGAFIQADFAAERAAAAWVIDQQGTGTISVPGSKSYDWISIKPGGVLPDEPFLVHMVDLRDGQLKSAEDLARLCKCVLLEDLNLTAASFGAESLDLLLRLPNFQSHCSLRYGRRH